jgi:hypothetical protein
MPSMSTGETILFAWPEYPVDRFLVGIPYGKVVCAQSNIQTETTKHQQHG